MNRTNIYLHKAEAAALRQLADNLDIRATRGAGAGVAPSITGLMRGLAAGTVSVVGPLSLADAARLEQLLTGVLRHTKNAADQEIIKAAIAGLLHARLLASQSIQDAQDGHPNQAPTEN